MHCSYLRRHQEARSCAHSEMDAVPPALLLQRCRLTIACVSVQNVDLQQQHVLASEEKRAQRFTHVFGQHVDMLEKRFPHEGVVALRSQLSEDNDSDSDRRSGGANEGSALVAEARASAISSRRMMKASQISSFIGASIRCSNSSSITIIHRNYASAINVM
jgi:hypothetical protein